MCGVALCVCVVYVCIVGWKELTDWFCTFIQLKLQIPKYRIYFWKSSIQYLAKKVDGQIKYEENGGKKLIRRKLGKMKK